MRTVLSHTLYFTHFIETFCVCDNTVCSDTTGTPGRKEVSCMIQRDNLLNYSSAEQLIISQSRLDLVM